MSFREKIKALQTLQIEKKRFFKVIVVIELILLLLGIVGLFGKDDIYFFDSQAMTTHFGTYSAEQDGVYVDNSLGQVGNAVDFANISLPAGVYRVALLYDTDSNMKNRCTVTDASYDYKTLLCNGEHLYAGLHETDFTMWLLTDKDNLTVHSIYEGEGSLTVKGLQITETNALSRMWIFWVLLGSLILNAGILYVQYDKVYSISKKDKNVAFGLALVILFSALPLMMDGMISGGDLVYHLQRIEGIKDGILSGQFPVRIAPEWQQGYGYASSVFYGETILYLAAMLRMIGFSVVGTYRMFLFAVNAATVLVAYYSFRKMFGDKYIGLLCSMVYTLSIYRISKTFICGSIGETFGILFLPLIAYGFWRVFTQDIREKSYQRAWLPLTVGFTGLLQSHLLSCEQVGGFTILLCILLWKKVFRPKTFMVLAKTVIFSSLLSAWFLIPFLDYMVTGDFVIKHVSGRTIQSRGLYPAHLLFTYFESGANVFFADNGMRDSQPIGVGISLLLALTVWIGLLFFRKSKALEQKELVLGKIAAGFGILAMGMSLAIFPWDKIQSLNALTATLVSSIQFPNRFLTIATVCLTIVAGVVAKWVAKEYTQKGMAVCFAAMTALVSISSVYLMNEMMNNVDTFCVYNEEGMGTGYIAGAEYLPYGADPSLFVHRDPIVEDNIVVEHYEKDALTVEVTCHNTSDREGAMELPLLYYKGYEARDMKTGEPIPIYIGNNSVVGVAVPAGFEGMIQVTFESRWYWRVAEVISVMAFAGLCVVCFLEKKKEAKSSSASDAENAKGER